MTFNERDYITPNFGKEPELKKCGHCHNSSGFVYVEDSANPEDPQLIKEECDICEGSGWVECD